MKTSVLKPNEQLVISTLLVVFSVLLFASTAGQSAAADYDEKNAFCTDITSVYLSNYEYVKAFKKCMRNADQLISEYEEQKERENLAREKRAAEAAARRVAEDQRRAAEAAARRAAEDQRRAAEAAARRAAEDERRAAEDERRATREHRLLGEKHYYGKNTPQNYEEAAKWFGKAAEAGDATAQFHLGSAYANGDGVLENDKEAVKWYRKAAEQGHANAQNNLAFMYFFGTETRNCVESLKWFKKAAEQGYSGAAEKAQRVSRSECLRRSLRFFANSGDATAQLMLGEIYKNGVGVENNRAEAMVWYGKAAHQGYAKAQFNLGMLYASKGINRSCLRAVQMLRKAAEQRYPGAQKAVDRFLENGCSD